jgi:NADH-quinone oxidoreductase subunit H
VTNLDVGLLYIFAISSLGIYGIIMGAWASNSKYALFGGLRSSSQMISYELAMGISLIALLMVTGTLSLKEMVVQQQQGGWGGFLGWNILKQPLGFLIFLICAFAECNRTPFDLPEAENELIGGYHTEYSSMKLGLFLFAEYINMFVSSAVISALYFGGYHFPGESLVQGLLPQTALGQNLLVLIGVGMFFAKILFFIFFFMWVRWTIARFRYDQLMNLGWKSLIPLAIANIVITGGVLLAWPKVQVLFSSI